MSINFNKDIQYYKFCAYGFLKNLRFFEPFILLFFLDAGLSYLQIGILYSIREITTSILEIPSGIIADAIGRRRSMVFCFVCYIISFIIFYFSNSYILFIVAMFVFAIGAAFRTGNHKAMIFEYLSIKGWTNQKVHYYGHTRSWSQKGSALSSILAAIVVFMSGNYRLIFLFSIIPYVIDLLLMLTYPKELDGDIKSFNKKMIVENFKKISKEFLLSLKNIKILKATANLSVYTGYYKAIKDYLQPVIQIYVLSLPFFISFNKEKRISIFIGIIYFVIYFLTSFAAKNSGNISNKFSNLTKPLNISILFGLILGIISGLFLNLNLSIITIFIFICFFLVENIRKPIGIAYVSDMFDRKILSTALSFESQVNTLFAAIIAPVIGYFADTFGIGNGLIIVSLVLLISSPLYYLKSIKNGKSDI
ncbi:MAG: MFS transporter [Bacteroidales bacterium]|nr:MFS transporter [Bacteroidales bacterium]